MNLYYFESVQNAGKLHIVAESMRDALYFFMDEYDCEPDVVKIKEYNTKITSFEARRL